MKKADVQINATYAVKVAGNLVPVKITAGHPSGGWVGTSVKTGKTIRVKSPQRLRKRLADAEHIKAVHKADQENARLDEERAASPDGQTASERAMATSFATLDGAAFTQAINAADVATLAAALAHETDLSAKQRSRIQAALDNKRKTTAPTPGPQAATPATAATKRDTGELVAIATMAVSQPHPAVPFEHTPHIAAAVEVIARPIATVRPMAAHVRIVRRHRADV